MTNGTYSKANTSLRFWRAVLNACLLIAFAFFVTWKLSPSEHHSFRFFKARHHSGVSLLSSSGGGTFLHNARRSKENNRVFESLAESEDDIQEEGAHGQAASFVSLPDSPVSDKILSALSTPFYQNRTRVPLFILYHSWKNFLG